MLNSNTIIISGETGTGKTEFILNYVTKNASKYSKIYIADLDVINPYFRTKLRTNVLPDNVELIGSSLVEYDSTDLPAVNSSFKNLDIKEDELLIIDLAGSINGLRVLRSGLNFIKDYEFLYVVNMYRYDDFATKIEQDILSYQNYLGSEVVTGIINNSNLMDATTIADINLANKQVSLVASKLNLPIKITTIPSNLTNLNSSDLSGEVLSIDKLNRDQGIY